MVVCVSLSLLSLPKAIGSMQFTTHIISSIWCYASILSMFTMDPQDCKISHMLQFVRSSVSHTWLKNLFPISGTQPTKLKEKSQRDKFEIVNNCRTSIFFMYACSQCCHGPNLKRKTRGRWNKGKGKKRKKGKERQREAKRKRKKGEEEPMAMNVLLQFGSWWEWC